MGTFWLLILEIGGVVGGRVAAWVVEVGGGVSGWVEGREVLVYGGWF